MGKPIIKAAKDLDLYCEWSSIVDAPTFVGTRAATLAYLTEEYGNTTQVDTPEVWLARADAAGTSAIEDPHAPGYTGPLTGAWDDTGFIVEQRGWLPRASLARFLQLILDDDVVAAAYALLEPLDGLDGS